MSFPCRFDVVLTLFSCHNLIVPCIVLCLVVWCCDFMQPAASSLVMLWFSDLNIDGFIVFFSALDRTIAGLLVGIYQNGMETIWKRYGNDING